MLEKSKQKHPDNKTTKITSSSETHKTANHDGSYLLLFGKRQLQSLEISLQ